MRVIDPGHCYQLEDGNCTKIVFRHRDKRLGVIVDGATSCDVLEMMIHRITELNIGDGYCIENASTLLALREALHQQKARNERLNKTSSLFPSFPSVK